MSSLTRFLQPFAVTLTLFSVLALPVRARESTHTIDAGQSKLQISVGKSGLLGAFGHDHLIEATNMSGSVQFDPRNAARDAVNFSVTATSLRVMDPSESAANRDRVQLTMLGPTVLDAAQFPDITFTSTGVGPVTSTSGDGESREVFGNLRLHGVERPLRVPVQIRAEGAVLRVRGEVTVRQTDFGITPVTAAGGTVRVKDEVKISFEIVAVPRDSRLR